MPAFYIVLQESIPGVEVTGLGGRALSKYSRRLDALAKEAGVPPLLSFFSAEPEEVAGLLSDGRGKEVSIPEEHWFPARDGLKTVTALLASLSKLPPAESFALAKELEEFRQVLNTALSQNVRWHLGIDY
jgi:hypothetical protein